MAEDWSDLGVVVVVVVVLGEKEECLFCCARQTPAGMSDGQETADVDVVVEELVASVVVKGGGVLGRVGVVGSGRFRWVLVDDDDTVGGLDDSSADKKEEEEDDSIPALRSSSFSCDDSTNFPSVVVDRLWTTIRTTTNSRQFHTVVLVVVVEWRVEPGLVLPFLLLLLLGLFLVMMLSCAT